MKQARYLFLSLLFIFNSFVIAQDSSEDIIIGKRRSIYSKVLAEERPLLISLPANHDQTPAGYPVIYVLDGDAHFQHATSTVDFLAANGFSPDMIVVAIPNIDRNRDFTPTHMSVRPTSGGADKFLKFMSQELFPYIEANYNTRPYRILMGHSLGGMFAIYTLFHYPDMYQAAIAVSPYLAYDGKIVLQKTDKILKKSMELNRFLYITLGNEPNYTSTLGSLQQLLTRHAPKGFIWKYQEMPQDHHMSVPLKSLYSGLEELYQDWRLPQSVSDQGLPEVKGYYRALSDRFGYAIEAPENIVNQVGYRMLQQNRHQEAIEFFMYNVEKHPESANVYDSLGEGYEAIQKYEQARENYELAAEKGHKLMNPNTNIYLQHLRGVEAKIVVEK